MHKIKNNPTNKDDAVNKKYVDDNKVDKKNITTTIDSTSTDTQVPSAKSVYLALSSNLKNTKIMYLDCGGTFSYPELGIDSNNAITEVVRAFANYIINTYGKAQYAVLEFTTNNNSSAFNVSLPNNKQSCIGTVKYMPWQHTNRIQIILTDLINGNTYIGSLNNSDTNDIVWQKVCTTSVEDVPSTPIISENADITMGSNCVYEVTNGICYVTLWGLVANTQGKHIICTSLPKAKTIMSSMCCYGENGHTGGNVFISNKGTLYTEIGITGQPLYGTLSYPVAES